MKLIKWLKILSRHSKCMVIRRKGERNGVIERAYDLANPRAAQCASQVTPCRTGLEIASEQDLLFGRAKQDARERASGRAPRFRVSSRSTFHDISKTEGHFACACVNPLNDNSVGASNLMTGNRKLARKVTFLLKAISLVL